MHHNYPETHKTVDNPDLQTKENSSAVLSIIGLIAWLFAMVLAIAGPLLNINISSDIIVGMVIFSGLFSLFSLPRLLGSHDAKDDD